MVLVGDHDQVGELVALVGEFADSLGELEGKGQPDFVAGLCPRGSGRYRAERTVVTGSGAAGGVQAARRGIRDGGGVSARARRCGAGQAGSACRPETGPDAKAGEL